jgi:hypothetical protein
MVFVKHEISKNQPCEQIFYAMFVRGYAKDSNISITTAIKPRKLPFITIKAFQMSNRNM